MGNTVDEKRLVTVRELAQRWRLSATRIYEMVAAGQIRSIRLTGTTKRVIRFRLADIEAFEQRRQMGG